MEFESIPTVPTADEVLDRSFRRAAAKKKLKSNADRANEEFVRSVASAIHDKLVSVVKKSDFPPHITPEVGKQLQIGQPDGRVLNVAITEIEGESVTLDANHPLAGKTLIFEIELVEIAA